MKTKLIEWLNERVKECEENVKRHYFIAARVINKTRIEVFTEVLAKIAELEKQPPRLTWQETPEGITAEYNGVKIAVIAYSYHSERFHFLYPYPIYDLAEDREFPRRLWKTLEQGQTAIQENFDVFYKKYKGIFR
jgi:hypothetical protein